MDSELDTLKISIRKAEKALESPSSPQTSPPKPLFQLLNAGVDLIAAVFMGTGLGLLVDRLCQASPWGLISFFSLGVVAGFLNLYRGLTAPPYPPKK